jgi:hypothetical protein
VIRENPAGHALTRRAGFEAIGSKTMRLGSGERELVIVERSL